MQKATNHLKEIRQKELLSINQLARLSDIDAKTVSRIEKGVSIGNEITRRKLVRGLNNNPKKTREYSYEEVFD